VRYLIAGGIAANLHGSVRATRDVDLLVPRDVANMRRLLDALAELPFGIARELDAAEIVDKAITIIGDDPRVDVLTVAWTVTFEDAWPRRIVRRIDGCACRTSRRPTSSHPSRRAGRRTSPTRSSFGGPPRPRRAGARGAECAAGAGQAEQ
jgi:hypothetical protein